MFNNNTSSNVPRDSSTMKRTKIFIVNSVSLVNWLTETFTEIPTSSTYRSYRTIVNFFRHSIYSGKNFRPSKRKRLNAEGKQQNLTCRKKFAKWWRESNTREKENNSKRKRAKMLGGREENRRNVWKSLVKGNRWFPANNRLVTSEKEKNRRKTCDFNKHL